MSRSKGYYLHYELGVVEYLDMVKVRDSEGTERRGMYAAYRKFDGHMEVCELSYMFGMRAGERDRPKSVYIGKTILDLYDFLERRLKGRKPQQDPDMSIIPLLYGDGSQRTYKDTEALKRKLQTLAILEDFPIPNHDKSVEESFEERTTWVGMYPVEQEDKEPTDEELQADEQPQQRISKNKPSKGKMLVVVPKKKAQFELPNGWSDSAVAKYLEIAFPYAKESDLDYDIIR